MPDNSSVQNRASESRGLGSTETFLRVQTKSGQEESSSGHALNPLLTSRKHELQSLFLLAVWGFTLVARRTLWLGLGLPLPVRAIMPSIPIP